MSSTDCNSKRCDTCAFYEFYSLIWISVWIVITTIKIIFFTANFTKLSFNWNSRRSTSICNSFRYSDIFFKRSMRTIDHNRCITSSVCLHSKFKTASMI